MKKITITIKEPAVKLLTPQPEEMQINIEGLIGTEVILLLLSAASQIASNELPPISKVLKESQAQVMNPNNIGKA